MRPALGATKRKSNANNVDLPAPEGPTMATRLPGSMAKLTFASASSAREG